jgi:hypothetical protein
MKKFDPASRDKQRESDLNWIFRIICVISLERIVLIF